jgi:hypothetical protein
MQTKFKAQGYFVYIREGKVSITKNHRTLTFSFSNLADLKNQMKSFNVYIVKVRIFKAIQLTDENK